jgi:eukaryotic-like serine/threonine-protein kinase
MVTPTSSASAATETVLAVSPKTTQGTILGTVFYMSPEQAEGKPVDHRSDIFSFGALLYEMTTGRRAFQGGSAVSTLSAILTAEPPPLSAEVPGVPVELGRIASRCLRKAPDQRWQSIADVRIALEELKQDLESGRLTAPVTAGAAPGRRRWMPIVAATAALVIAAIAGFLTWQARPPVTAPEIWRLRRLTSDSGATLSPAISRDGRLVAYVSDRASADAMDLWVQQTDGGDSVQLTRNLRFCLDPAFSPDGSRIVVRCDEPPSIYVVPTFGGLPRKLADGESPQFSPDGSRISYLARSFDGAQSRSVWISSADGTDRKEIKIEKSLFTGPVWHPDGRGLLFTHGGSNNGQDDSDWYFVAVDGGALTPTGAARRLEAAGFGLGRYHSVTADGVLFTNGSIDSTGVYRMPFDAKFQNASGPPVPVVVGAGVSFTPTASQDGRRIAFAIGNNVSTNIWRAPIDPGTGRVAGEPVRVTSGIDQSLVPSPSRDGTRIAYLGGQSRAPEVRLRDVATGKDVRLAEAKTWSIVVLSQDGSMVAFNSDQRENSAIYAVPAAGGVPKKICAACGRPVEWSPDRAKLFVDNAGPKSREIHLVDVATGQSQALLQHTEGGLNMPRLSPDGRVLTFSIQRPGRARRIYLAPFTGKPVPEAEWTVLVDGADFDRQPFWAPSGNLIYFLSDRDGWRCMWAQRVDLASRQPAGAPFAAQHMHQVRFNLEGIPDVAAIGLSVAGGHMFYASYELQMNIWMAERQAPLQR